MTDSIRKTAVDIYNNLQEELNSEAKQKDAAAIEEYNNSQKSE